MKRFASFAATGLFTAGLAVLPFAAIADTKAPVSTDTKSSTTMHAPSADAKSSVTTKDAGKSTDAKAGVTVQPGAAKTTTTGHDKGA